MTYLSYQRDAAGKITAVPSSVIDWHSKFWRDGNILTLNGLAIGFNVSVFSARTPGGEDTPSGAGSNLSFNKTPIADAAFSLDTADTGRLHGQSDGSVLVEWPL